MAFKIHVMESLSSHWTANISFGAKNSPKCYISHSKHHRREAEMGHSSYLISGSSGLNLTLREATIYISEECQMARVAKGTIINVLVALIYPFLRVICAHKHDVYFFSNLRLLTNKRDYLLVK